MPILNNLRKYSWSPKTKAMRSLNMLVRVVFKHHLDIKVIG